MPFLERLLVIDEPEPRSGAFNMALDELLLTECAGGTAVLRFYRWETPTVSFGYFETATAARRHAGGRPVVRRMTGGGLVDHGEDLTYTLVVPRPGSFADLRSTESYQLIHGALASALASGGVTAEFHLSAAGGQLPSDDNACFQRPVQYDLVVGDRKIAGGAQRRNRTGLIHQGSVLFPSQKNIANQRHVRSALPGVIAFEWEQRTLSNGEIRRADALASAKYATSDWTDRC